MLVIHDHINVWMTVVGYVNNKMEDHANNDECN